MAYIGFTSRTLAFE